MPHSHSARARAWTHAELHTRDPSHVRPRTWTYVHVRYRTSASNSQVYDNYVGTARYCVKLQQNPRNRMHKSSRELDLCVKARALTCVDARRACTCAYSCIVRGIITVHV